MMNKIENDILLFLKRDKYKNQRFLAQQLHYSLGVINQSLNDLSRTGYIDSNKVLTDKSKILIEKHSPKNAIILAAGFGMRMVPINTEIPKGLLKVKDDILIERIIKQLHEKGITDIQIVVGFLKEKFEYLIDKYKVKLVYNPQYNLKNNLHSLALVKDDIKNSYIIPSDVWCEDNPFNKEELSSWYMVTEKKSHKTTVKINRKLELVSSQDQSKCCEMIGIAYVNFEDSLILKNHLSQFDQLPNYDHAYWETAFFNKNKMLGYAKIADFTKSIEIDTYEQLREFDNNSDHLKTDAIEIISQVFDINENEIKNIQILKKGMTNRSFLFSINNENYIMRIPGEGTDQLINRQEEADVYNVISQYNLCDEVIYLNPENGYKITKFYSKSHVCDPKDPIMIKQCINKLKQFHALKLKVSHYFDLFKKIDFYENLWEGNSSIFEDYIQTKSNIFSLKKFIEQCPKEYGLTHIDAVPDNFLFTDSGEIRLIDWEYASMQDTHVDLAMFSIYSMYDKKEIDQLIDLYFDNKCCEQIRYKIYAYIAICGLLWSNWCEYKRNLGIEFGEYSLAQYRYAKEYYRMVNSYIEDLENEQN